MEMRDGEETIIEEEEEEEEEVLWSKETVPEVMKIVCTCIKLPQRDLISLLLVSPWIYRDLISHPYLWLVSTHKKRLLFCFLSQCFFWQHLLRLRIHAPWFFFFFFLLLCLGNAFWVFSYKFWFFLLFINL